MKMELLSRGWFALKNALHHCLLIFFTLPYKTISTFAPTTASNVEPPGRPNPSLSSLPDDVIINCLARIPRSYYPKLSLVSKTFRSLILSSDLHLLRRQLKTVESLFHVCLQLPGRRLPSWFSLWIKPDHLITDDMEQNYNKSTGNTLLVGIPSSHVPYVPTIHMGWVGSKFYRVRQSPTSSPVIFFDNGTRSWRKAPRMKVAREKAVAGILDGKIYVMGGCSAEECTNWAEVFDTMTQVWESLPEPGAKLRFLLIKRMKVTKGKVYIESSEKNDYFYDPKEGRWGVAPAVEITCAIENVWYYFDKRDCRWYDTKHQKWSVVHGLEAFNRDRRGSIITLANYGGKLLICWDINPSPTLWDRFVRPGHCRNKNIWCSVIALERRNGDEEVWGKVEWSSVVLTVPSSYDFLRSEVKSV